MKSPAVLALLGRLFVFCLFLLLTELSPLMLEKENLIKLARMPMPFGKYAGRVLIDLPEEYLLWFAKKGFPEGELGRLLQLCLALKIEGLDSVVKPLKY